MRTLHSSSEPIMLSRLPHARVLTTGRSIPSMPRLAQVQGAVEAVQAVKTGVEQSTKMAEKAAAQVFANLRRAIDFREKAMLKVPTAVA